MGSFVTDLLPRLWGGARDEDNELLVQIPGVNAPVPAPVPDPNLADQTVADFDIAKRQEGGRADKDIEGALDRQDAQRELMKKLDVIKPDQKGPRLPNQVTQAELEHYALVYSNVRMGRGDLTIDASKSDDPKQYKRDMMDDVGDLMQTTSGREMLDTLSNNVGAGKDDKGNWIHRHTTVGPFLDKEGNVERSNSNEQAIAPLDQPEAGHNARFANGKPGVGTDARVHVNPNMDVDGSRSDVILFHELAHALADTTGVRAEEWVKEDDFPGDANTAKDAAAFKPRYEHQAAGLGKFRNDRITENAYRKERRRLALTGKGLAGDLTMSQRENYTEDPAPYSPVFGL